jgi:hypothetical protein
LGRARYLQVDQPEERGRERFGKQAPSASFAVSVPLSAHKFGNPTDSFRRSDPYYGSARQTKRKETTWQQDIFGTHFTAG